MISCLLLKTNKHFQRGSTIKEKNLLEEDILSFKSKLPFEKGGKVKVEELTP